MTIDTKALRERIVNMAHPSERGMRVIGYIVPDAITEPLHVALDTLTDILDAADRLAALELELERERDSNTHAGLRAAFQKQAARADALEAENQRLREALRRFLEYGDVFAHRTSETNPYEQAKEALAAAEAAGYRLVPDRPLSIAYALRYTDPKHPYWIGIWSTHEVAEDMMRRHGGKGEVVTCMYAAPDHSEQVCRMVKEVGRAES